MRVGMIGTGAIAAKHAEAYRRIGYEIVACTNRTEANGRVLAARTGAEFFATAEEVCSHPRVDFVDVCTMPDYRLQVVDMCARTGKHVLVQKPMAIALDAAARMITVAREAGITLGVVSQHRFDDSVLFLKQAIADGRLGKILQADAYVKWYRSADYYRRPIKGSWAVEGGGALINQGVHQVDLLLYLIGAVKEVSAYWKLGALHRIESEDMVSAVFEYASGAVGVIQAATAFWPGYPERIEIHGTKGTAVVTGDRLTTWDVQEDVGTPAPLVGAGASGASDPMAISTIPFERQLKDFGEACRTGREPACSGVDGYRALQLVESIYTSCREARRVAIPAVQF